MNPIKTETFPLKGWQDRYTFGKSLVIPLSRSHAFRIGGNFHFGKWYKGIQPSGGEFWCFIGPRRYQMVVTQRAVEDMADIFGDDLEETKERFRKIGAHIEGELTIAEGE